MCWAFAPSHSALQGSRERAPCPKGEKKKVRETGERNRREKKSSVLSSSRQRGSGRSSYILGRSYRVHHWGVPRRAPGLETVDILLRPLHRMQIHGPRRARQCGVDQRRRGAGRVVAGVAETLGEADLVWMGPRATGRAGVADEISCALLTADAAPLAPPQAWLSAAVHAEPLVALRACFLSRCWGRWKRRLCAAAAGGCASEVDAPDRRVLEVTCVCEVGPELASRGIGAERAADCGGLSRPIHDVVRVTVVVHARVAPACASVDLSNWLFRWADGWEAVGASVHSQQL